MKIEYTRPFIFDKLFHLFLYGTSILPNIVRGKMLALRSESVGTRLRIDEGCLFFHTHRLRIGKNVWIGRRVFISARGGLTIGDDVLIAFDSVILTEHHVYTKKIKIRESGYITKPVKIGNNVLVGAKAMIMPGVTIGDNVVIGANSVVTKNIPSNSIAAGIPAKVIRNLQ